MNKNIFSALLLDETETLCVVKPFNLALSHFPASFFSPVHFAGMWVTA